MSMAKKFVTKEIKEEVQKKVCSSCKKDKRIKEFYTVKSMQFPDGKLNICVHCVKKQVDITDVNAVIAFLRTIDKPFLEKYWNEALTCGKAPLGEYIRKVNSLQQVSDKGFDDSDGMSELGNVDASQFTASIDEIETEAGEKISYNENLVARWGSGYKKFEILKLEKFYQDMMMSYEVIEANHKQMLMQLAKITIEMDNLLAIKDYTNYTKLSKTFDDLLKSTGFRPIDKKNGSDSVGLFSFSQVWAEIEKEGFVQPDIIEYEKDDIDYMLLYYIQFAQRLVGKNVSEEPITNWRDEIGDGIGG
jgi:hypothetical protein